jgi:hyperosmotically inducible protein
VKPSLKSDAEKVVRKIEGVEHVENRIEVLPTSSNDDRLRRDLFIAIYRYDPLQHYGVGSNRPIRIIVNHGNVTLEGVVDHESDKNMAGIRANGVPGVFSVKNNLVVPGKGK